MERGGRFGFVARSLCVESIKFVHYRPCVDSQSAFMQCIVYSNPPNHKPLAFNLSSTSSLCFLTLSTFFPPSLLPRYASLPSSDKHASPLLNGYNISSFNTPINSSFSFKSCSHLHSTAPNLNVRRLTSSFFALSSTRSVRNLEMLDKIVLFLVLRSESLKMRLQTLVVSSQVILGLDSGANKLQFGGHGDIVRCDGSFFFR